MMISDFSTSRKNVQRNFLDPHRPRRSVSTVSQRLWGRVYGLQFPASFFEFLFENAGFLGLTGQAFFGGGAGGMFGLKPGGFT